MALNRPSYHDPITEDGKRVSKNWSIFFDRLCDLFQFLGLTGDPNQFLNGEGVFTVPGGAPGNAEYLVSAANGTLSAERVATDTPSIEWDFATAGVAKANVPDGAISNAKLADMAEATIKGRAAGAGTGDPTDLTASQVRTLLDVPTTVEAILDSLFDAKGDLLTATADNTPARLGVGTDGHVLTADSAQAAGIKWAAASGGGVSDGDKGDITVTGSGATWTIDNDVVTPAKLDNGAAVSVLGRSANSSGDRADIASSANGEVLQRQGNALAFSKIGIAQYIKKANDESVTSSTTLQDDDELAFAIGANEEYEFEFVAFVTSTSSTPDFKSSVTFPAGASGCYGLPATLANSATTTIGSMVGGALVNDAGGTELAGQATIANLTVMSITRGRVVNGGTPGTVQFRWCQHTSSATATTVKGGTAASYVKYTRVA